MGIGDVAEAQSNQTTHQITPATFGTYFDIDSSTEVATLKDAYKSDTTLVFGPGEYRNAMHIEDATNVVLRAGNAPDSASAATLRPRLIIRAADGVTGSTLRPRGTRDAVFAVTDSTNVTLDRFNFAFDCVHENRFKSNHTWGIFYQDSSGAISNNLLLNMRDEVRRVTTNAVVTNPADSGYYNSDNCGGLIGSRAGAGDYRIIRVQTSSSYEQPVIDASGKVTNLLPVRISGNQISYGELGIHLNGYLDATVSENDIRDMGNHAVNITGAASAVVSDNKISNASVGIAYYPNWFLPNSPDGETVEANLEIRGNDISGARFFGIALGVGACAQADGTTVNYNVKIIGNYIHDGAHGIQIVSCTGTEDERIKVDIIGNTLEGTPSSLGIYAAPAFVSTATAWFDVNAKYNVITGYSEGVRITDQDGTYSINRARIHATHNYWGTGMESPAQRIADNIGLPAIAGITYEPWLHNSDLAGHTGSYGTGARELSDLSELPGYVVEADMLAVVEAQRSSFRIRLDAAPPRDMRATFGSDNSDLSFSPSSVTFTPDNWDTPRTVTVSAARDADVNDEQSVIWAILDDGGFTRLLEIKVTDAKLRGAQHLINRLEPTISQFTLSGGDTVRIGIVPYGRQDIVDDALIDGKTDVLWTVEGGGGKFREAEPSLDSDEAPDDRVILFTAPETPGTYTIHATLASCGIDTSTDCRATFTAKVRRRSLAPGPTPAPKNPVGEIPSVLADAEGRQYEVFTPEDGGSFDGDDVTLSADPGVVPNLEIVGVRVDASGPALNAGMTAHRYTLVGDAYDVLAVDADGAVRTSYVLNSPVEVCVPLPPAARHDISDVALVADNPDGTLTVLSASVRITGSPGVNVCGNLGTLPATIAVSIAGSPDAIPTATPDPDEIAAPDTGGYAPVGNALMLLVMMGAVVILGGLWLSMGARRRRSP